jgi:type IV pilus assembly protein PilV
MKNRVRLRLFQHPMEGRRQDGATLIEVMITLLVLAIGLLGMAALQAVTLRTNQTAYFRSQATNLAYAAMDHARANRSQVVATGALPDLALFNARAAELLPGGTMTAVINASDFEIELTVSWTDARLDAELEGGVTSFQFESRF